MPGRMTSGERRIMFTEYQAFTGSTAGYSSLESERRHTERLWWLGDRRVMSVLFELIHAATEADIYKKWIRDGEGPDEISNLESYNGAPRVNFDMSAKHLLVLLGLIGEVGEVADLFHTAIEERASISDPEFRAKLTKELGDVLWYVSELCSENGLDMGDVARANIKKIQDRAERGKIHGSGNDR